MLHKIKTYHKHPQGRIFSWMTLILGFGLGLVFPVFPNFVKTIVHSDFMVSVFFSVTAVIMLTAAMASTVIFKKIERTTIVKTGLAIAGVTLFLFIFVTRFIELAVLEIVRVWFEMIILIALALFVRDFANAQNLGREEGRYCKFHNIGVFLGPLTGGFIGTYFGNETVFILAAFIIFFGLFYFYKKHIIEKHPAIINSKQITVPHLFQNIKKYFSSAERIQAYFISLIYISWISFKRIYIPLYVVSTGYLQNVSGLILAISIIPFILFEVKIGEYGDKYGLKKPITMGFFVMTALLVAVFLTPIPILNFILLTLISFGGTLIEPLNEVLAFRNIPKEEEENLYGIYKTSDPIAFFLAPAIGAITLLFFPLKALFLIFGIMMLSMGLITWTKLKY